MKNIHPISIVILLIVISSGWLSCSLRIEKRRYRPGYHVEVSKPVHHRSNKTELENSDRIQVDVNTPVLVQSEKKLRKSISLIAIDQKTQPENLSNNKSLHRNKHTIITNKNTVSKIRHRSDLKKTNLLKGRKIAAWILGGVAISLLLMYLILGIASSGGLFNLWILLIGMPIASLVLAIVSLMIRYVGAKKDEYNEINNIKDTTVNPKLVKAAFYVSMTSVILAIAALIIAFLSNTFFLSLGLTGFIFSMIALLFGITGFSLGFKALGADKSAFTKLAIILGFLTVALVAACVLIILIV